MRGILSILFLVLLINPAQAMVRDCSFLFSHDFDSLMPKETSQEAILRSEVQNKELIKESVLVSKGQQNTIYKLEKNKFEIEPSVKSDTTEERIRLKDAIDIMENYYSTASAVRGLKASDTIGFNYDFLQENSKRFAEVEAGILFRAIEYLAAKGIKYRLVNNKILILPEDAHFMNQFALRALQSGKLVIVLSVRGLVEGGAAGMFWSSNNLMELSPEILLKKSFFRDDVFLHEYTHFRDIGSLAKKGRPYQSKITIQKVDGERQLKLGIYATGFSLDEIKAYRASIRVAAHNALTTKNPSEFLSMYQRILKHVQSEVIFSEIAKRVYGKLLKIENDSLRPQEDIKQENVILRYLKARFHKNSVYFSDEESYFLKQKSSHDNISTYKMVAFTLQLFSILESKLVEYDAQDIGIKRQLIQKIVSILSIPEVRRLNGNYPSTESIEAILQQ